MAKNDHAHDSVLKSFLIGGILGGAAGYVAGLLTAPRPGKETREVWRERLGQASEQMADVMEHGKDVLRESQKRASEMAHSGKSKSHDLMESVMEKVHPKKVDEEQVGID